MGKRTYTKRVTSFDSIIGGKYADNPFNIEILISTVEDGNMDPRFSKDALLNYRTFLEKYGIAFEESFSPALGANNGIIEIDENNEEKYAGKFIGGLDAGSGYHCDAVIVSDTNIAVAFRPADCPVILITGKNPRDKNVISLIHAGRAELTAEFPKITVEKIRSKYHTHIPSATAYVFPHICKHCYALKYLDPNTERKAKNFLNIAGDHYHIDLLGWLIHQLAEVGIRRIVTAHHRCTAGISPDCVSSPLHSKKKFKGLFSHYRSFHTGSPEGRFIIAVRIAERLNEDD